MCLQIDYALRPFRRTDNILQIKKKEFKAFFTPLETDGIIGKKSPAIFFYNILFPREEGR
jgi:hypothetical protein